jgi:hypothetical protein
MELSEVTFFKGHITTNRFTNGTVAWNVFNVAYQYCQSDQMKYDDVGVISTKHGIASLQTVRKPEGKRCLGES